MSFVSNSAGESRGELIAWMNDLLQLNLTKVEQAGTGASLCQIVDSIYGDVPLNKVKFNAIHEYEYVANFKVLQDAFDRHHIDKIIPVDRLIKLKFQDNLEFLQWMKRFWDANYPNNGYDAVRRRSAQQASTTPVTRKPPTAAAASRPIAPKNSPQSNNITNQTNQSSQQFSELKLLLSETLKERDFYYGKLRQIETLVQKTDDPMLTGNEFFKAVNDILYATEEGFEIPQ